MDPAHACRHRTGLGPGRHAQRDRRARRTRWPRVAATRAWTDEESVLAAAIAERLRAVTPTATNVSSFDGLVSHLQCLVLLGEPGVEGCVDRLLELAPDGWPDYNDATLGTAAIVLGGLAATEAGCDRGAELAAYAADRLLAEAEETPAGLNWLFVPRRLVPPDKLDDGRPVEMPNWSHGLAGIAGVLARAGVALSRPDLVEAARRGAEHLVTLADPASLDDGGLAVPRRIPHKPDMDEYTWNWCHGPAGTLGLFEALDAAGVPEVAGGTADRLDRPLPALPAHLGHPRAPLARLLGQRRPLLRHGRRRRRPSSRTTGTSRWRWPTTWSPARTSRAAAPTGGSPSTATRSPLLPPGVGWMQGAAGIAGFLFDVSRA